MKQIVSGTNTIGISSSMTGRRRTSAIVSPATNSARYTNDATRPTA